MPYVPDLGRLPPGCGPRRPPSRSTTTTSTSTGAPSSTASAVAARGPATASPTGTAGGAGRLQHLQGGVGAAGALDQGSVAPGVGHPGGQPAEVDLAALGVQVELARPELDQLGEPAADGEPLDRMALEVAQQPPGEVAHVEHGGVGQARQPLDRALRGRARAAGHVALAGGPGQVDAAVDRVDPGRARVGDHHAGGAEDRQPADDAEPRVPRCRPRSPPRRGSTPRPRRRAARAWRAATAATASASAGGARG